ncbi:MAG: hypothetical protein R3293_22680 [Candidatus Promineifilaceae bacterium]|nr:hypothetical protein [Candidatus Promineifilaceae bacterium]
MAKFDQFLGTWELLPEKSRYDEGFPPVKGTYGISADGDRLTFEMAWTDVTGEAHQMAYSEICDGRFHPYADADIADEICLTLKSDALLESVAKKNGITVLIAQRILRTNTELQVIMSGPLPSGGAYRNVAYYKKQ